MAPLALSTRIGNGIGQSRIQCIGTPPKKPGRPLPIFAADFGRALRKASASRLAQLAMRAALMPPIDALRTVDDVHEIPLGRCTLAIGTATAIGRAGALHWVSAGSADLTFRHTSAPMRGLWFWGDKMRTIICAVTLLSSAGAASAIRRHLVRSVDDATVKFDVGAGVITGAWAARPSTFAAISRFRAAGRRSLRKTVFEDSDLTQYWLDDKELRLNIYREHQLGINSTLSN